MPREWQRGSRPSNAEIGHYPGSAVPPSPNQPRAVSGHELTHDYSLDEGHAGGVQ